VLVAGGQYRHDRAADERVRARMCLQSEWSRRRDGLAIDEQLPFARPLVYTVSEKGILMSTENGDSDEKRVKRRARGSKENSAEGPRQSRNEGSNGDAPVVDETYGSLIEIAPAIATKGFDALAEGYLIGTYSKDVIDAVAVVSAPAMRLGERRHLEESLQQKDVSAEKIASFFARLGKQTPTRFQRYLETARDEAVDLEGRLRTIAFLLSLCRGQPLHQAYESFEPVLAKLQAGSLIDDIMAITAEVVDAKNGGVLGRVQAAVAALRERIKGNREQSAVVEAIKDSILIQLDPDRIDRGGLRSEDVERAYLRINPEGSLSRDNVLALYCTVGSLLRATHRTKHFTESLKQSGLRNYARLHGSFMEFRIELSRVYDI
jgi:hypothetical protein